MKKIVFWVMISFFWASPCFATGVGEKVQKNAQGGYTLTEGDGDQFVAVPDGAGGYMIQGPGGYTATAQPDGKGGYTSSDSLGYSYQATAGSAGGYDVIGKKGGKKWVANAQSDGAGGYSADSHYE